MALVEAASCRLASVSGWRPLLHEHPQCHFFFVLVCNAIMKCLQAFTFNLDSSIERARVDCWRRVWVGATTRKASAFKEDQHPHTCHQQFNRVCSALTQRVNCIKVQNVNFHKDFVKIRSGQLRNLGSSCCQTASSATCAALFPSCARYVIAIEQAPTKVTLKVMIREIAHVDRRKNLCDLGMGG